MVLQQEIDSKRKQIKTDGYPMSIGELASMYKDGELNIRPEFQRMFRWKPLQRTKLIESLFLGIPLPSIFVSQDETGVWEVVDGVQRLSTIFEFIGILKDENGQLIEPSRLLKTDYLPSLERKVWNDPAKSVDSLTEAQRLFLKREKIDIKIVKKESDNELKYELFQRLNTLGTRLSDQEVRNCILVMINKPFFEWIKNLSEYPPFLESLSLADSLIEQKYNQELVLRFLIFKSLNLEEIRGVYDLSDFITKKMRNLASDSKFDSRSEEEVFKKTFDILNKSLGDNSFKKYNKEKERFEGKFLVSAFEAIAIGVGININQWDDDKCTRIIDLAKKLWADRSFIDNSGSGVNVTSRIPALIPIGKRLFQP